MDARTESKPSDLIDQLPRATYRQIMDAVRCTIPALGDAPQDLARRDSAVIAQIAALRPRNADEANLALQSVVAFAQAQVCLRMAREVSDHGLILKCGTQAGSMIREARAARSLLLRIQAARRKRCAASR